MVVLGLNLHETTADYAIVELVDQELRVQEVGTLEELSGESIRDIASHFRAKTVAIAMDEPKLRISAVNIPDTIPKHKYQQYVRSRSLNLGFDENDDRRAIFESGTWIIAAGSADAISKAKALAKVARLRVTRIEHAPTASIRVFPAAAQVIVEATDSDTLRVTLVSHAGYAQIRTVKYEPSVGVTEPKATTLGRDLDKLITEAESKGFIEAGAALHIGSNVDVSTR